MWGGWTMYDGLHCLGAISTAFGLKLLHQPSPLESPKHSALNRSDEPGDVVRAWARCFDKRECARRSRHVDSIEG